MEYDEYKRKLWDYNKIAHSLVIKAGLSVVAPLSDPVLTLIDCWIDWSSSSLQADQFEFKEEFQCFDKWIAPDDNGPLSEIPDIYTALRIWIVHYQCFMISMGFGPHFLE